MRNRKTSRERRPLKRGCFGTSCHLGGKVGGGARFRNLARQPDKPQGTPESSVPGVAQYSLHRQESLQNNINIQV